MKNEIRIKIYSAGANHLLDILVLFISLFFFSICEITFMSLFFFTICEITRRLKPKKQTKRKVIIRKSSAYTSEQSIYKSNKAMRTDLKVFFKVRKCHYQVLENV